MAAGFIDSAKRYCFVPTRSSGGYCSLCLQFLAVNGGVNILEMMRMIAFTGAKIAEEKYTATMAKNHNNGDMTANEYFVAVIPLRQISIRHIVYVATPSANGKPVMYNAAPDAILLAAVRSSQQDHPLYFLAELGDQMHNPQPPLYGRGNIADAKSHASTNALLAVCMSMKPWVNKNKTLSSKRSHSLVIGHA